MYPAKQDAGQGSSKATRSRKSNHAAESLRAHRLIGARVAELQRRRVEKSPRQRLLLPAGESQFSRRAVERVANDRMAEGGKMNSNLMRAAGTRVGRVSAGPA
jgi:hypothetical protein